MEEGCLNRLQKIISPLFRHCFLA